MFRGALVAALIYAGCCAPALAEQVSSAELRISFGRPEYLPFPVDNQFTAERAMLGRILFFDPRLSESNLLACASCHNPSFGWGDGQALGRGHAMVRLTRRSPTILNLAWAKSLFWDGRAETLEQQARGPISSPGEMNMPLASLGAKIAQIPGYRPLFDRAYPGEGISVDSITRAIATFERSIVSHRSAFDRWVEGDDQALTAAERRGLDVFVGPGGCAQCHSGWNMTDNQFHDTGLDWSDLGRGTVEPERQLAQYAFKTPSLRDTVRRAPYMHNGGLQPVRRLRGPGQFGFANQLVAQPDHQVLHGQGAVGGGDECQHGGSLEGSIQLGGKPPGYGALTGK
jgi:cytochrome c peroxidase